MRQDLLIIGSFALSIFLFLSCFGILGPVGNFFAGMMFGLCGATAYVLPLFVFASVLYYEFRRDQKETPELLGAAFAVFLTIGVIAELASGDLASMPSYDLADLYSLCSTYKRGGGILAGSLCYLLYHFIGVPGTVLVIILVLALCTVILSQKPLLLILREQAKRARAERIRLRREEEQYRRDHPEEFEEEEEEEEEDYGAPYVNPGEEEEEPPFEEEEEPRYGCERRRQGKARPEKEQGSRVRFFRGTPDNTLLNPASYQKKEEKPAPKPPLSEEAESPKMAEPETGTRKEPVQEPAETLQETKAAPQEAPAKAPSPEVPPAEETPVPGAAAEAPGESYGAMEAPEPGFLEDEEETGPLPQDLRKLHIPEEEDDYEEEAPKAPGIDFFEGVAPVSVDSDPIHLEAQYDAQQATEKRRADRAPLFASENLHEILPEDYGGEMQEESSAEENLILPGPDESREALPLGMAPPLPTAADYLNSFVPQDVGQEEEAAPAKVQEDTPSRDLSHLGVLTFDDDEWIPEEDSAAASHPAGKKTQPESPAAPQAAEAPAPVIHRNAPEAIPQPVEEVSRQEEPTCEETPQAPSEDPAEEEIPVPEEAPVSRELAGIPEETVEEEKSPVQEEKTPSEEGLSDIPIYREGSNTGAPGQQDEIPEEAPQEEEAPLAPQEEPQKPPTEIYHADLPAYGNPPEEPARKEEAKTPAPQQPIGRPAFRSRTARDFVTSEAASDASDILVRKEGTLSGKTEIVEEARAEEARTREVLEAQEKQEEQTHTVAPIQQEEAPEKPLRPRPYVAPPMELLRPGTRIDAAASEQELRETAAKLQSTLETFGVRVHITEISQGPAVTRYEMQPEMGVKVSKILSLQDDIKLALAATDIRIEAPIPGKSAVGVEVPNQIRETVSLRDVLDSNEFKGAKSKTAFGVGKDLSGKIVVTDIAKMPHVLIAGATGSGKSVCINTMIMSILYHASPSEVKLIMIDPKVVELSVYNGIPHLMLPVVTDSQKAAATLNWCVAEMESRFRKFADNQVRDIKGYNALVKSKQLEGENDPELAFMPSIVIIVDELADLMMVAKSEVETAICRLAQLARAAGMHLVIATQRPSVDVITGLIKANMPSRIAFAVTSGVDSRTILDMNGAEKLLGKGDMLFFPYGLSKPVRIQGAFVTDDEVNSVVNFLKTNDPAQESTEELEKKIESLANSGGSGGNDSGSAQGKDGDSGLEDLFVDAGFFIIEKNNASIGLLQRRFRIGFNKAARIMDQLCEAGVVSDSESTKSRKILMTKAEFQDYVDNCL